MSTEKLKLVNKFFGGIVRDDKASAQGVASNVEELDIFTNADYVQAEQIFSSYALPASTEIYAYTSGIDGTLYAYGKETSGNKVRILSVATGGAANPSTLATLFTSADATNLAYSVSPVQFFKTTDTTTGSLYYVKGTGASWYLVRYNITSAAEQRYDGSAWVTSDALDSNTQLGNISGSYDKISMKVMFGELFITNGNFISKIDKDGVLTLVAFTLPREWNAVDLIPVSDVAIILGRYIDRTVNYCKGFWWDLTSAQQVDDSFDIPSGGPQWIINHKETIKILTAINGTARFYQLSGAFPGAVVLELPGLVLNNVATETSTQSISPSKTLAVKERILYFGLWKTDKSGVYGIGQIDSGKPTALILSKRFSTTDYSLHKPTALYTLGANFFAAYDDNGTNTSIVCKTLNSPNRSTSAIYESIWIDDGDPFVNKKLNGAYLATYPLPASSDVNLSVQADYSGSYTEVFRADGTSLNTTSAVEGWFTCKAFDKKKVFKIKMEIISNGSSSPKVVAIGLRMINQSTPATQ